MTNSYQNLADWIRSNDQKKTELFREFRRRGGRISFTRFLLWCSLDGSTNNEKSLSILSQMTGIPEKDLFRVHEYEN